MLLIDWSLTRKIARFSIWGMITTILASLPGIIFPLVVTNLLQERDAAFFYMDLMIVNMLYVISLALSQSLFVEGSYDITKLVANIKKASRIILLVLIPGILGVSIFGRFVLAILGADYAREGTDLLIIMAFSAIPMSVIYIGHAVLSVSHRQPIVAAINLITVIILLVLSAAFANRGLVGMGYAWLITYVIAALLYISTTYNTMFDVVKKWLFRLPANQP